MRPLLLVHQLESIFFIQMPGRLETLECPEIYLFVFQFSTKIHGDGQKLAANTSTVKIFGNDEPPQMGPLGVAVDAIDNDGPFHTVLGRSCPETIPQVIETIDKPGQLGGNLGLEKWSESPTLAVIPGMHFSDAANGAGNVSAIY